MKVVTVEFLCPLPVPGPVYLQLQGIRDLLPMMAYQGVWSVSLELPPGVYAYRLRIADRVNLNDPRRSTQRQVNGETWSVVQVCETGPIWVERTLPMLTNVEVCRGISDSGMPLVVVEQVHTNDLPVILWQQIDHVFQDALIHVFLLRPDEQLTFAGEFLLEQSNASPNFDMKFWLSINIESASLMEGMWTFLVQLEGGPVAAKQFRLVAE